MSSSCCGVSWSPIRTLAGVPPPTAGTYSTGLYLNKLTFQQSRFSISLCQKWTPCCKQTIFSTKSLFKFPPAKIESLFINKLCLQQSCFSNFQYHRQKLTHCFINKLCFQQSRFSNFQSKKYWFHLESKQLNIVLVLHTICDSGFSLIHQSRIFFSIFFCYVCSKHEIARPINLTEEMSCFVTHSNQWAKRTEN